MPLTFGFQGPKINLLFPISGLFFKRSHSACARGWIRSDVTSEVGKDSDMTGAAAMAGDYGLAAGEGERVVLSGRYEIFPDQPLPHLDTPSVPAFLAADLRGSPRPLVAMICRTDHCPRIELIPLLKRLPVMAMIVPLEGGLVYWPSADANRAVLIFEQPKGRRLVSSNDEQFQPWREDHISDRLIMPLISVFEELGDNYLSHRAIRLDNLFLGDQPGDIVTLGECVTSQPGYHQPLIYETIDRAETLIRAAHPPDAVA